MKRSFIGAYIAAAVLTAGLSANANVDGELLADSEAYMTDVESSDIQSSDLYSSEDLALEGILEDSVTFDHGDRDGRRGRDGRRDRDHGRDRGYRQVQCESWNYRPAYCHVGGRIRDIVLVRQLSKTHCVYGRNYWLSRDGIQVDQGCRAVFGVYFRR